VKLPSPLLLGVGLGLVALVGLALAGRKLAAVAASAAPLVTPSSSENIVYGGIIGGTGRALSGDKEWTLGGWVRDLVSSDDEKIRAMLEGAPPKSPGSVVR
jgi:hypothetical protein